MLAPLKNADYYKSVSYTVERVYLNKYSVDEFICKLIKSHINHTGITNQKTYDSLQGKTGAMHEKR